MVDYKPGDEVQVYNDHLNEDGKLVMLYTGTILRYWRNNCFIVKNDNNGTTCAHNQAYLARR